MTDDSLKGRRILVVEDEYLIADDLRTVLMAAGAEVIGPWPTVSDALECITVGTEFDAAILDVNLRGDMIFPVADALAARSVPFIFATGYDEGAFPDRFYEIIRIEKPLKAEIISRAIVRLLV